VNCGINGLPNVFPVITINEMAQYDDNRRLFTVLLSHALPLLLRTWGISGRHPRLIPSL